MNLLIADSFTGDSIKTDSIVCININDIKKANRKLYENIIYKSIIMTQEEELNSYKKLVERQDNEIIAYRCITEDLYRINANFSQTVSKQKDIIFNLKCVSVLGVSVSIGCIIALIVM